MHKTYHEEVSIKPKMVCSSKNDLLKLEQTITKFNWLHSCWKIELLQYGIHNANTIYNCKLLITRIYRLFSSSFIPTLIFFWNKINKGLFLFIRLRILRMVQHNQICIRNFPTYDSLYSSRLLLINWWTISTRHGWKYGTSTHYAGHGISFI